MLILLALPVIATVAATHRYLAQYAPTNVLIRRVRRQEPRWRTVLMLAGIAAGLLVAMHGVLSALANGAPGWLNLIVAVLAWDAIKVGWMAVGVTCRCIAGVARRSVARGSQAIGGFVGSARD